MPKPCSHDAYPLYKQIIGPLRQAAHYVGYCLAVHGTLRRDIDLLAVPWVADAIPAPALAGLLMEVTRGVGLGAYHMPGEEDRYHSDGCPMFKPHGRRCWTWYLLEAKQGTPYVDLSVMPTDRLHWESYYQKLCKGEGVWPTT